jgi:hypothetical protein
VGSERRSRARFHPSLQKEQIVFQIEYIFTILFLAMGPLRTIPVFYELTRENDWPYRIRAAVFATLIAGAIIALVAIRRTGQEPAAPVAFSRVEEQASANW